MKIYRIEICCSDDSCTEFWFNKPISDFYLDRKKAEAELAKYKNYNSRQLEILADVIYVGDNKPYIEEYNVIID